MMDNLIIDGCMGMGEGEWELLDTKKGERTTNERHRYSVSYQAVMNVTAKRAGNEDDTYIRSIKTLAFRLDPSH